MARPRVVIVGAGFGGLWALRALARAPVDVVLIDRQNYHTFLPLLYQVAAAVLEPEAIAYPVRSLLRPIPGAVFLMADVRRVDLQAREVQAGGQRVPYDFLILAAGSTTNYFGVEGAVEHAFPLKTLPQGLAVRNHILSRFEAAAHEPDPAVRRRLLTFAIAGGGPTGVEFAGALVELVRWPLRKDFGALAGEARIVLLEALDTLLPGLPRRLQDDALLRLRRRGVEVRLGSPVARVTREAVELGDGTTVPTETVVWTAGVRGIPGAARWGLPVGKGGRVSVRPTLQAEGHPEVFVAGDLAYLEDQPLPMIAPVAIQQGRHAARGVLRRLRGREPEPFRYRERGTMVTIGRNAAVAEIRGVALTGFPAWVLWLGVHLVNLIGFRNRLLVLMNWAWDYFFFERVARLIVASPGRRPGEEPDA